MAFRFRKSFKIAPGLNINLGKKSLSASIGPKGLKHTIGTSGRRTTIGAPGTGISFTTKHRDTNAEPTKGRPLKFVVVGAVVVLALGLLISVL